MGVLGGGGSPWLTLAASFGKFVACRWPQWERTVDRTEFVAEENFVLVSYSILALMRGKAGRRAAAVGWGVGV